MNTTAQTESTHSPSAPPAAVSTTAPPAAHQAHLDAVVRPLCWRLDDAHPPFLLLEYRGDGLEEVGVPARRRGHELDRRLCAGQRLRRLVPQRDLTPNGTAS